MAITSEATERMHLGYNRIDCYEMEKAMGAESLNHGQAIHAIIITAMWLEIRKDHDIDVIDSEDVLHSDLLYRMLTGGEVKPEEKPRRIRWFAGGEFMKELWDRYKGHRKSC